jgi:bifunctional non-homologous end joining protein LigD
MASPRAARPGFVAPMTALGVAAPPAGGAETWQGEIKFDGYRAIAVRDGPAVQLWSRNEKPLDYPEIAAALRRLRCRTAVLDGEIVALDAAGRSRFQLLQGRDLGERPPIRFYVFDLLHLDGAALPAEPFEARRAALERLLRGAPPPLLLSPLLAAAPAELLHAAWRQGLEGVVLKRRGSRYESGRRSGAWLKLKNVNEQEFVIGGFTPPRRSREHFGAILVGYHAADGLRYAGKVGTGFDAARLADLHARFRRLRRPRCPFVNLPLRTGGRFGAGMSAAVMRTVTWLRPRLVAQVRFAEWTQEGLLRQPVFLGLRADKPAAAVRREAPAIPADASGGSADVARQVGRAGRAHRPAGGGPASARPDELMAPR